MIVRGTTPNLPAFIPLPIIPLPLPRLLNRGRRISFPRL